MSALAGAIFARWLRIALVTLALLAATFLVVSFMPRLYESSASILVEVRDNAFLRATNDTLPQGNFTDETAIASHIELIKSRGNLLEVIKSENLTAEPEFNGSTTGLLDIVFGLLGSSEDAALDIDEVVLANVADALSVVQERDSRVITVSFRSQNAALSARVANAIAENHVSRRAGVYLSDTADATRWLQDEITKLRASVAEAEDKVANYRVENDLYVGANETSLLDQQLSDLSTQISAAQERKTSAQSRAALIRDLVASGQSIESQPDVRGSVVVQQLQEEKVRLQGERAQLSATLLPSHPNILALDSQIAELNGQIETEARQVASALEAEARIEASLEQSLRDELTRLKMQANTATKGSVTLNELEREARAQRDLLETYLLRYRDAASRTESSAALPDVRVVSTAAPPLNPAYPQTMLILAAVGIVSVVLQVGQILFAELVAGRAFVDAEGNAVSDRYREPEIAPRARETQPNRKPKPRQKQIEDDAAAYEGETRERAPAEVRRPRERHGAASQPREPRYAAAPAAPMPARLGVEAPRRAPRDARSQGRRERRDPDARHAFERTLADIAGRLGTRGNRVLIVASLGRAADSRAATEALTADLVARGISTVEIDAGSRRMTPEAGLADLCAGNAGFGEVVHRGSRSDFAIVPWGQMPGVDFTSPRCATLVEALKDIFDAVVIDLGRLGLSSGFQAFLQAEPGVLLIVNEHADQQFVDYAREDLRAVGLSRIETVTLHTGTSRAA